MGSAKPKPVQAPFQQQQQQQQQQNNTFGQFSIADSPEAKDFYALPLDFGGNNYGGDAYKDVKTDFDIDPGVGRRTDLAEQEAENRYNSAFSFGGAPSFIREANRAKELRQIRGQGAAERQQAEYGRQLLGNQASLSRAQLRDSSERARAQMMDSAAGQRTNAGLMVRERLLPQILQTGGSSTGSGSSSGFNTQIVQPQPGFWQRAALSAIGGASSALTGKAIG